MVGDRAILESYAASSRWGRGRLDEVLFESEIEPAEGTDVGVVFTDILRKGELRHVHRCRQVFTVGARGKISNITHHDLPGEPERLKEFFRRCGIEA